LIDQALVTKLYRQANAARWQLPIEAFASALEACAAKAFKDVRPSSREVERHLAALHLEDLALAAACAAGHEGAWEHFVLQYRPALYRAADAMDATGGAREIADSLYADLYGLPDSEGERRSLFRYFHARASLSTWLRAVLAQRQVDRLRVVRRTEPLADIDPPAPAHPADSECAEYRTLIQRALAAAVAAAAPRDRLRLACYYAQELPLSKTGRILGESEATASRHLARTRRGLRAHVERWLRDEACLTDDRIARAFECAAEDPGALDLSRLFDTAAERKEPGEDRST
jgi:RNA polymerase sigma-70 factor, ECF subfamily